MSGYYPDGVTGNELAIAGPDRDYYEERDVYCNNEDCPDLEKYVTMEIYLQSYRSNEWGSWTCPTCNAVWEYEGEIKDWDYDYEYYDD